MHKIPTLNRLSEGEIRATWYSEMEFEMIRGEIMQVLSLLSEESNDDKLDGVCLRGLECHTSKGRKRRTTNRESARNAVIREQDYQWYYGEFNPEELAEVYMEASRHCSAEAHYRALKDRYDVEEKLSDKPSPC